MKYWFIVNWTLWNTNIGEILIKTSLLNKIDLKISSAKIVRLVPTSDVNVDAVIMHDLYSRDVCKHICTAMFI